jgi:hypothetical protein
MLSITVRLGSTSRIGKVWKTIKPDKVLDTDWGIILKCITGKQGGMVWTGLIWLKIGTGGGPL